MNLLKETGKLTCKSASIPIYPNHKLGEAEEDTVVDRGISNKKHYGMRR